MKKLVTKGIICPSYGGSTVWNAILGGAGETHWLIDAPEGPHCTECYPERECPIYTPELVKHMKRNEHRWWSTLSEALELNPIITSDKMPVIYQRLGIPDIFLFSYKDPRAHVLSFINHELRAASPEASLTKLIDQALEILARYLNEALGWLETIRRPVIASRMEMLAAHPEQELRRVCEFLDHPYDPSDLTFWEKELHYVRGNFSLRRHHREGKYYFSERLKPDLRWKSTFTCTQSEYIMKHPNTRRAYDRLGELVKNPRT